MNVPQTASGRPRDRRPGSPLNAPPIPASNFVLGEGLAYSRDDGTPGCGRRWKRSSAAFELGAPVAFAFGMAGIAAVLDQLPAGAIVASRTTAIKASQALPTPAADEAGGRCIACR
jgi:hypothetical protein